MQRLVDGAHPGRRESSGGNRRHENDLKTKRIRTWRTKKVRTGEYRIANLGVVLGLLSREMQAKSLYLYVDSIRYSFTWQDVLTTVIA